MSDTDEELTPEQINARLDENEAAFDARKDAAESTLLTDWGDDYHAKMPVARYGIQRHLERNPDDREAFKSGEYGNEPETAKAALESGSREMRIDAIHKMQFGTGEERLAYTSEAVQSELRHLYDQTIGVGGQSIVGRNQRTG